MTQKPAFSAGQGEGHRGATSPAAELPLEQRIAELERASHLAAAYSPFTLFQVTGWVEGGSGSALKLCRAYNVPITASGNIRTAAFYGHDTSSYALGDLTLQWRLIAHAAVNATAPGVDLVFSIENLSAVTGGASALTATSATVSGSTVTFTTPSAGSENTDSSGWIEPPNQGTFAIGLAPGGSTAANSEVTFSARLEGRYVVA